LLFLDVLSSSCLVFWFNFSLFRLQTLFLSSKFSSWVPFPFFFVTFRELSFREFGWCLNSLSLIHPIQAFRKNSWFYQKLLFVLACPKTTRHPGTSPCRRIFRNSYQVFHLQCFNFSLYSRLFCRVLHYGLVFPFSLCCWHLLIIRLINSSFKFCYCKFKSGLKFLGTCSLLTLRLSLFFSLLLFSDVLSSFCLVFWFTPSFFRLQTLFPSSKFFNLVPFPFFFVTLRFLVLNSSHTSISEKFLVLSKTFIRACMSENNETSRN